MIRGYPIGYCILWEAPDDQDDKKSSIGLNDKNYVAPKELVIDGQQRLAGPYASLRDCRANFACLDYQTNIHIGDDDPKVYVARFRSERGDEAYSKACAENALPEGFENMEYTDFLAARQRLMAAMIREAFGKL